MLARAGVLDRRRLGPVSRSASVAGAAASSAADGLELLGPGEVRGARDRDLAVVEIGTRTDERERLDRLRRRAEEDEPPWIAGLGHDLPVPDGDGVDGVHRLDDAAARHLDLDRVGHSRETTSSMPELPEVEAWVRELDPLVSRAPVERAGPAHIATVKTFDPPLARARGTIVRGCAAAAARTSSSRPHDGELVLRVHLMSAGRLRYHAPGAKTPKTPMFRLTFADGGELVLTEAGKKKRAGVWLFTPEALEAELAHLGPDALGLGPERLARDPRARAAAAASAPARPAGARGHRPGARERDPLAREALAVQALDRSLRGGDGAPRDGDRRRPRARARAPRSREGRRGRLPDPRALRRAVPARPRHAPARRVRGAHDHVLPDLPDRRQGAEGPAAVAAAAVGSDAERRSAAARAQAATGSVTRST